MLTLRRDRHRLNVEMMDLGILLTQVLSGEQWIYPSQSS